jgi:hypothetical protein
MSPRRRDDRAEQGFDAGGWFRNQNNLSATFAAQGDLK